MWFVFFFLVIAIIIMVILVCKRHYHVPKVIYTYWDNIEENEIIQAIIRTWSTRLPAGWTYHVISKITADRYVETELLHQWESLQDPIRFSDFLRVYLLNKHGGVWMDAGILITKGSFLEIFHQEMMQKEADVLLYEFKVFSTPEQPYLENWFFMCPTNSRMIKDMYLEFMRSFSMGFLRYKTQVLAPHVSFRYLRLQGDDTYHIQHGILHYLKSRRRYPTIIIKEATESMFKAQEKVGWNDEKLIQYLIENQDWSGYYAIKLTGANRAPIVSNQQAFLKSTLLSVTQQDDTNT